MNLQSLFKRAIALVLTMLCLWAEAIPTSSAFASELPSDSPVSIAPTPAQTSNGQSWYEIDRALAKAIRNAEGNTREFAESELKQWENKLVKRIDHPFLDWYFDFGHQKATELGVPFAWLAFKMDALKVLRSSDEKNLNANQVIEKRMLEEFNHKFAEMVLDQDAADELKAIVERIGRNYASAIDLRFAQVKDRYHVPEQDWNQHLERIAQIIYDTGTQKYSLTGSELADTLVQVTIMVATAAISTKMAANLATKAASKLAIKGGEAILAKWGASLLDPAVAIGFIAWDIWDYQNNVAKSRPDLHNNLTAFIHELQQSILENSEQTGIMDTIEALQEDMIQVLQTSIA